MGARGLYGWPLDAKHNFFFEKFQKILGMQMFWMFSLFSES